jgi:hypothetical protein
MHAERLNVPRRRLVVALLAITLGCLSTSPATPTLFGEGRRVLFIGNSLTYINDLPGIVQALAESAGVALAVETIAGPDMALIDHWNGDIARREVEKGWELVVLQQGPSSVEVNRDALRLATKLFNGPIVAGGGKAALFSAWPQSNRTQDFPRAIESYRIAAADVNGIYLPVAAAWLAAWRRDASIALYSDGLHASAAGSYLSALVIYAKLLNRTPIGLPARVRTRGGGVIVIDSSLARLLQEAAAEAVGSPR